MIASQAPPPVINDPGHPSSQRFAGKRCLVTGAGAGIGRAVALRLAAEGAAVVVADKDLESAEESASLLDSRGVAAELDVRSAASVDRLFAGLADTGPALDVVVNNAGIEILGDIEQTEPDVWDEIMAVNLRGPYLVSRAALPLLKNAAKARGYATIVNNASLMGLVSSPGLAAYCASKSGLVSLTRSMALDCAGFGIRVNCVCPGIIHTSMLERRFELEPDRNEAYAVMQGRPPVGYLGHPADVAAAIAYLAAEESRFVTGIALTIDGGVGAE